MNAYTDDMIAMNAKDFQHSQLLSMGSDTNLVS